MVLSSPFNTLYCDLSCPQCQGEIVTGIGFRIGSLTNTRYKIGDTLNWQQEPRRPEERPAGGNIVTLGHFNCDNPKCTTWKDCYPAIQTVKITIEKDRIINVAIYTDTLPQEQFAILTQIKK
jgi:hypothetical protein